MIPNSPHSAAESSPNGALPEPPTPRRLAAVWCCSVGTTWTLELRESAVDNAFGPIVDWISSGVPVSQPEPAALAHELLTERGLLLLRDSSADSCTRSRHHIGYVYRRRADHADGNGSAGGLMASCAAVQPLGLTVTHPTAGVCVVTVDGELDILTAPLLDVCLREQFAAAPRHLVLDLERVHFLGARGVTCLRQARKLAQQTPGSQLHLAGGVNRVVARPLQVTGVLEQFDIYPTLADALATLTD